MSKRNPNRKSTCSSAGTALPVSSKRRKTTESGNTSLDISTPTSNMDIVVKSWSVKSRGKKNQNQTKVILRCPRKDCSYETKPQGFQMRTARTHLLRDHMSKDPLCQELISTCPVCDDFYYLKESEYQLFSKHLGNGSCGAYNKIKPVIEGQALTITDMPSFNKNEFVNRYDNIPKRAMKNVLVDEDHPPFEMEDSNEDTPMCAPTRKDMASSRKPTDREILQFITNDNRKDLSFSIQDPDVSAYIEDKFKEHEGIDTNEIIPLPVFEVGNEYESDSSQVSNIDYAGHREKDSTSTDINAPPILEATSMSTSANINAPPILEATSKKMDDGINESIMPVTEELNDEMNQKYSIQETAMYLLKHRHSNQSDLFSEEETAYISLLKLLDRPDIPLCVFDEVTKWVRENHSNINPQRKMTRKGINSIIQDRLHGKMKDRLKPIIKPTCLPSGTKLGIPVMDFEYLLANMLINDELISQDKLLIDLKDPLKKRDNASGMYGDIDTGSWYSNTYDKRCTDRSLDVLLPLIAFIDGTVIDKLGKQSLEPIALTLGIFNRNTRYKPESWFTLGCIENSANIYKFLGGKKIDAFEKARDYHHIIKVIMDPIRKIQNAGGFDFFLPKRDFKNIKELPSMNSTSTDWTKIRFKPMIQFIIGDTEGFNKLCLKKGGHNTMHLCRDCDVKRIEASDSSYICNMRTLRDMVEAYNSKKLDEMSFLQQFNSFWLLDFGENEGNIYQATLNEILHMLHAGILLHAYDEIQNIFNPSTWLMIERIAQSMAKAISCQTISKLFPPVGCFVRGLNPGTSMTAKEKLGRMFLIYLVLSRDDVARHVYENVPDISESYYMSIVYLLERLLGSHGWMSSYYHDKKIIDPPSSGEDSMSQDAMRRLMDHIVNVLPRVRIHTTNVVRRKDNPDEDLFIGSKDACKKSVNEMLKESNKEISESNSKRKKKKIPLLTKDDFVIKKQHQIASEGNGWNIPKLHALLHIVDMVTKHGVMANANGGPCESHFKINLKKPAKTTQRRNATFACDTLRSYGRQIAQSQAYKYIPQYVTVPKENKSISILLSGSRFQIGYSQELKKCVSQWTSKRMKGKKMIYPASILDYVAERFFCNRNFDGGKLESSDFIHCFTEAVINGENIRAHPNYQSEGERFDWISVQYENLEEPAIGKVLLIMDFRSQRFLSKEVLLDRYGTTYLPTEDRVTNEVYLMMKFSKDEQPSQIGHCGGTKKLRLMKRYVMDNEPKFDLVPLSSFYSKELVFEDTPCVPFTKDEKDALRHNKKIKRKDHVSNLNKIFPVESWSEKAFLSNPLSAERRQKRSGGIIPYSLSTIDDEIEEITFVTNKKNEITSKKRGTNIVTNL